MILKYLAFFTLKVGMAANNSLEDLFQEKLDITNDYSFLNDPKTIEFIANSKIMFINRFFFC